jgi:hypothetical protein
MLQLRAAVVGVISLLGCSCSLAADPGKAPAPGLRLSATTNGTAFRSPQDVSLRIILSNDGPECHGVLLDPEFSLDRSGPRPFVKLNVTVRRLDGQPLQKIDRVDVITKGISAESFYLLDCGRLIGVDLKPSHADWPVQFPPGRYGVEVSAELTNRSFVDKRPDLMGSLSKWFKKPPDVIGRLLAEGTIAAPSIEFEVQGQP